MKLFSKKRSLPLCFIDFVVIFNPIEQGDNLGKSYSKMVFQRRWSEHIKAFYTLVQEYGEQNKLDYGTCDRHSKLHKPVCNITDVKYAYYGAWKKEWFQLFSKMASDLEVWKHIILAANEAGQICIGVRYEKMKKRLFKSKDWSDKKTTYLIYSRKNNRKNLEKFFSRYRVKALLQILWRRSCRYSIR